MRRMLKTLSSVFIILLVASFVFLSSTVTAFAGSYYNNMDEEIENSLTSKYIYLLNMDENQLVYEKGSEERAYPASLTKIMTYIVVAEYIDDLENTMVTIDEDVLKSLENTGSSTAGVKFYEKLSILELLYCLMVPSGNDAAEILADYVGNGDKAAFVNMMNEKAAELGISETTHFANAHGLHDENHYTTAKDVAIMTKYALDLPYFSTVSNTARLFLRTDDEYPLVTTISLIDENNGGKYYYKYARGIKTGTTDEAGYCVVSTATKDEYTYLCVAMNAPCYDSNGEKIDNGSMIDSATLYDWAFENFEIDILLEGNTPVASIPLNYAMNKDSLLLVAEYQYSSLMPVGIDLKKDVIIEKDIPDSVDAPVKEGDIIGKATIKYEGKELKTINLVADESVEKSDLIYWLVTAQGVVTSTWFIAILIGVVILFVGYLVIVQIVSRREEKHAKND